MESHGVSYFAGLFDSVGNTACMLACSLKYVACFNDCAPLNNVHVGNVDTLSHPCAELVEALAMLHY